MTTKQLGMIMQGVGIVITAVSLILVVRLQPVPVTAIMIGIVTYFAGQLVRRIER